MNKLLIATIAGVLLSLGVAFATIYITTYFVNSSISETSTIKANISENKVSNTQVPSPYVFSVNVYEPNFQAEQALIAQVKNITFVNVPSSLSGQVATFTVQSSPMDIVSSNSKFFTVFYVVPNFIVAKPNSTIYFYLYLNTSFRNDAVYTDFVNGTMKSVSVVFIKNITGFEEYKVLITLSNVKPGTVIFLPVWDIDGYEVEYVVIWVVPPNHH